MTADTWTAAQGPTADYVIPLPPVPAVPVQGCDALFPVRRIYCVGRNYAAHAVEMGGDPDKEAPFFFQKNPDNLVLDGIFPYPVASDDVHHEVELVVALGTGGKNIPVGSALEHVFGYAVGLDMTRRDLQGEAKKAGRPWETGKAFESSAPCGPIAPATEIGHPAAGTITLAVNGDVRQSGDLNQLTWKVPEIIAHLSALFTLAPGDLIFTGTPSGVGPVVRGDELLGQIEGVGELRVTVV
ncbi:MAG: fumarylacetoacetate hydrolase family protein [Rhodospirillaceae bacterium]|nr:fumarylacetoacetate hydrolase family protein [Rhodospirillaceae bacterium]